VLSPREKRDLWESYRGDPLFGEDGGARWHGDYTNTEGSCPFDAETLIRMLSECTDPKILKCRVSREASHEGDTVTVSTVDVQVYGDPEQGRVYYLDIDPASGIADGRHNPAGLHISEMGSGDLKLRWNGYLPPYSVGVLGAGLARRYNNAACDIEMKDHWGVNVVRGFTASDYGNLSHELRELEPSRWAKEVGFDATDATRSIWIGCIQEWIEAYRAGAKYAACPSREVIESVLDTELDDRGKVVSIPGVAHGEDMVLLGQKLRRAVTRVGRTMPELYRKPMTKEDKIVSMIRGNGRPEDDDMPFDLPLQPTRNGRSM
jgi:hypothetical protein